MKPRPMGVDGLQGPIWTAWRLQRATWTAREAAMGGPGGSRQPFGLLGRLKRPTRRLRPSVSPGGSRWNTKAIGRPGRLQRAIWTARETAETDLDSPGGSRRGLGPLNLCIGRLSGRQLKGLGPLNLG